MQRCCDGWEVGDARVRDADFPGSDAMAGGEVAEEMAEFALGEAGVEPEAFDTLAEGF